MSADRPPHRLERLRAWMRESGVDCCVLAGADHAVHFTGYARYFSSPPAVVVDREGARTLLVNVDELDVARTLCDADEVLPSGTSGFGFDLDPLPGVVAAVAATPAVAAARRIGLADGLGVADGVRAACSAEVIDAGPAVARIRLVHDDDELARILRAYELAWVAHQALADMAEPGVREIDLFSAAHAAAQNAHGAPVEFVADLLSAAATAKIGAPIYVPGTRRLEDGDPILADIVIGADGYWGDSCETHLVGDNAEVAEVRAALLEIREQCAADLRPGVAASAIFTGMRERILERFPGSELPHHAGHAVGLTSFEDPHLIPTDDTPLQSSMVIALEPGVYFAGRFGARVEHLYLVTPQGGVELRAALAATA